MFIKHWRTIGKIIKTKKMGFDSHALY